MIKAIFFTRFHPEKGSSVLHQVPEGAVVPTAQPSRNQQPPLFDFPSVSDLIIPRQEFCDRLVTVCVNHYRIIGNPICIENRRYDRNQFIFNLAMVLDEDADFSGHMTVVMKIASMFRNLEEQSQFLSKEESGFLWDSGELPELPPLTEVDDETDGNGDDKDGDGMTGSGLLSHYEAGLGGKVYALCEMIMEDLNNYCECMIPIDDSNTINLKLFPTLPPPAPIYAWHVPLSTVQLSTFTTSSDLTLTRIVPYIDGVCSVAQIAELADTDLSLTRKAVQHLLYYGCVLLLDIFQFSAIYAPTAEIGAFVENEDAQMEAVRYVCMGTYRRLRENESGTPNSDKWGFIAAEVGIDRAKLVALYTSLKHGQTLKHWCAEHGMLLQGIDVRRFITFGIIKGFLYRVHKYVVANTLGIGFGSDGAGRHSDSDDADPRRPWRNSRRGSLTGSSIGRDLPLARYLDGMHCFDEICTELRLSEKKVMEKMKAAYGDVQVIHR
ncbi:nitrogen permease regulator 2 [Tothia fuscella]|uniref:Nitrogen permease regulator 2 n=1 Tax=Tothia fuscella TaxID=1048955 RepID=A0A9P4TXB1_9PEZI|nr:nitrogen permease regulator 2 [Tothia fuscella]